MTIKKKKRLGLIFGLGFLGLATITLPAFTLTACSTTSNPYGPFTNIFVNTPLGENAKFEYTTNGELMLRNNTGGINVPDQSSSIITPSTLSEIVNTVQQKKGVSPTDQVKINNKVSTMTIQTALDYLNAVNITSSVYSQILSTIKELVNFATIYQPFPFSHTLQDNGVQVSQWNKMVANNETAREFTYALIMGAGVGENMFSLWPSALNFSWKIVPTSQVSLLPPASSTTTNTNNKITTEASTNGSSNSSSSNTTLTKSPLGLVNIGQPFNLKEQSNYSYTIQVSNVSVSYSWFKGGRTGGVWANNISSVDNAMTVQQKERLYAALNNGASGQQSYKNLTYTFNIGNFDFNINANYWNVGSSAAPDNIFNGQYQIQAPLQKVSPSQENNEANYMPYQNGAQFSLANSDGTNIYNTLNSASMIKQFGSLYNNAGTLIPQKPIYNNVNNLPFCVYKALYLTGALADNNNSLSDIEKSTDYQNLVNNENNISNIFLNNSANSAQAQSYLNNPNYLKGLQIFYQLLNIGSMKGSDLAPNNIVTGNDVSKNENTPEFSPPNNGANTNS